MANTMRIIKAAQRITSLYDTRDPFEVCRQMDIHIRYHELGSIKAYYFCQSRIKNIVINSNADDNIKKILCAHELGHAVLHNEIAADHAFHEISLFEATTPTEYEANLFAAELLISDEDITEQKDCTSFYEIAQTLGVPAEFVDFKCQIMKQKGYNISPPSVSGSNFLKN